MKAILFSVGLLLANQAIGARNPSIYKLSATTLDGKNQKFSSYEGKVLLIVNIASQCGFTGQLKGLQELHNHYHKKGLRVLGFPSNSFRQEPLKGGKIANFCRLNYGVEFEIFKKSSVAGSDKNPIFDFLVKNSSQKNEVAWNFEKFIVDRNGVVTNRHPSRVEPTSQVITKQIEALLKIKNKVPSK